MSETQLPKIEKGIPVPREIGSYGSAKALLDAMEVGDSVLLPSKHANSIRTTAWQRGIKLCTRKVSATETRIWRMS
jgi:hypothetical protein